MSSAGKQKPVIFSGSTLVPVSFVLAFFGGVGWLTNLHFTTTANAQQLAEMKFDSKEKEKSLVEKLDAVDGRLSRMEGQLGIIYDVVKEKRRSGR